MDKSLTPSGQTFASYGSRFRDPDDHDHPKRRNTVSEVKYFRPRSYNEFTELLGKLPVNFNTVAGTTDFIPAVRRGAEYPAAILDISKLDALQEIKEENGRILIGAAATMADLLENELIVAKCPVLASAAKSVGSPLTRNRATIGGNIANASPSADTAPVLLTLNANVHLLSTEGISRWVPITSFFRDYKVTERDENELITGFSFETPRPELWSRFAKVGQRSGAAISVANMSVIVERDGNSCRNIAVAFGAVAPVPVRAESVEKAAKGKTFNKQLIAECCEAVQADISPISDIRGSAEYRRHVAANILARALTDAFA